MTEYYTKDGVKIEVGMEVTEPQPQIADKYKVVYIHPEPDCAGDCILCEHIDEGNGRDCGLVLLSPEQLTSVKKYNGYGLLYKEWQNGNTTSYENDLNCTSLNDKKRAFRKLISHHGCRPFVKGKVNYVMEYNYSINKIDWDNYPNFQQTPLCYDKPYPELEETFKQFLGV